MKKPLHNQNDVGDKVIKSIIAKWDLLCHLVEIAMLLVLSDIDNVISNCGGVLDYSYVDREISVIIIF